ncbi:MAG: translocation/assembly module TamB domain-containing protein [Thermodesulfobacteriota bacterium]
MKTINKINARNRAAGVVAALLIILPGCLFIVSAMVNTGVARHWLEQGLSRHMAGRVVIGDHRLSITGQALEIEKLALFSSRSQPILAIDHVRLDWRPASLLKQTLKIKSLRLNHVSVRLPTDVKNSLPPAMRKLLDTIQSLPGNSLLRLFMPRTLIVESAEITNLEIAPYSPRPDSSTDPRALSLAFIRLAGTLNEKDIKGLRIEIGQPPDGLDVSGDIRQVFGRPELDLSVKGAAGLEALKPLLNTTRDLSGQTILQADIRGDPGNPEIHAELTCRQPVVGPVVLDELVCRLDGNIQALAVDARATVPGPGQITAAGNLDLIGVFPGGLTAWKYDVDRVAYTLQIRAAGADLNRLLNITPRMKGRIGSDITITGRGISPHRLSADLAGKIDVTDFRPENHKPTEPLAIELAGQCRDGILRLDQISAETAGLRLTGSGHYVLATSDVAGRFRLTADDISGLAALAGYDRVSGGLEMTADVSGAFPEMTATGLVHGAGLSIAPFTVGDVDGRLVLSRGLLTVEQMDIRRGASYSQVRGVIHLVDERTGTAASDPAMDLTVAPGRIRLEDILPDRLKGEVTLSGNIGGTFKKPTGEMSLEAVEPDIGLARADRINLSAALKGDTVDIRSVEAFFPGDQILRGSGVLSLKERTYRFEAASEALALGRIRAIQDYGPVDGTARFSLSGNGDWGEIPALWGDMQIRQLAIAGNALNNMAPDFRFDGRLIRADIHGDGIVLTGTLDLTDLAFTARCDAGAAPLSPWLAMIDRPDLSGTVTGRLEAAGRLSDIPAMKASAEIDQVVLSDGRRDWCRAGPFRLYCEGGIIHVPGINLTVADEGTVNISGRMGFDQSVALDINCRAPFSMAEIMATDIQDMTGRINLAARVTGTLDRPAVTGEMKLSNIGLTLPDLSGRVHDISGTVRFQQENITINEITGLLGTGRFRVTGMASLEGWRPAAMDIRLTAESLPVVVPDKLDLKLDANLALVRDAGQAVVRGEVVLVDGVYFQDTELVTQTDIFQSPFVKKKAPGPDIVFRLPSFLRGLSLDLALRHRLPLKVDNNIGLLEILPDLAVKGNLDHPVIMGEARIESGEILFQRTPFKVDKGAVIFANPYKTEPRIDLTADTAIKHWKINLKATGTPDQLEITLTSDPDEEPGDILSLLVFGMPTREMTAGAGSSENQAETLAAFLAGTMSGDIRKATGLDIVEVSTAEESRATEETTEEQTNGRSRITVGSKVSDRLTLKYSVESGQYGLVQESATDYRLTETMTVSGFQNTQGVFGGELIFRYEFR